MWKTVHPSIYLTPDRKSLQASETPEAIQSTFATEAIYTEIFCETDWNVKNSVRLLQKSVFCVSKSRRTFAGIVRLPVPVSAAGSVAMRFVAAYAEPFTASQPLRIVTHPPSLSNSQFPAPVFGCGWAYNVRHLCVCRFEATCVLLRCRFFQGVL